MRDYELTFAVRPDIDDNQTKAAAARVEALVTQRGGQLTNVQNWGKRRMAYHIGNHAEASYFVYRLKMEPESQAEIEHELNLDEQVIRFITVHLEPIELQALENPPPPMAPREPRGRRDPEANAAAAPAAAPAEAPAAAGTATPAETAAEATPAEAPAAAAEAATSEAEAPAEEAEAPAAEAESPAAEAEAPAAEAEAPATEAEAPATEAEEPATEAEEPAEEAPTAAAEETKATKDASTAETKTEPGA